jgi:hypothetical protein
LVEHRLGRKVLFSREFSTCTAGRGEFAETLKTANCPAYLLVDLVEEDFRLETIPHLRGNNLLALLDRKFEQFYPDTPFRLATLQQRQTHARRDDVMLFSALTNPATILPWLELLTAQKIPLAGIYSVPQISGFLLQNHTAAHLLLVTWSKRSGLRQSYFKNQQLQVSRLTPLSENTSFANAVLSESARMYQYLLSLNLLATEQSLQVCIIACGENLSVLRSQLPENPSLNYELIEVAELSLLLGITPQLDDSDSRAMFLHQLAKQTTIQQYAPAQHRHYFALWRLRHALNWLSFALIVIAALWALQEGLLRKDPDESSIQKSQQQTAEIQRKAQQILRQQPKTDVAPSDLRAVVLSIRTLRKHAVAPQEFLAPLAHVMDRYPAIQLDELAWEISPDAAHPDLVGEIPPTIKLKAHLAAPPENDHFTLEYLEKYERELKNNGYEILSLSRPFDWMTTTSGQIEGAQVAHDYTLKLQWKITP